MIRLIDEFEQVETKQQEPLHAFILLPPFGGDKRGGILNIHGLKKMMKL
jgi:hypothetical protein